MIPVRASAPGATAVAVTAILAVVHQFNLLGNYGPSGWPELFAVVLYAISVWFAVRKSIWTWSTGIVSTAIYLYIFWDLGLYADAGLQVIFIAFSVSGLYAWWRGDKPLDESGIQQTSIVHLAAVVAATTLGTLSIRAWLIEVGGSAPLWDAVLTSASLGALYLLIRKRIESWYFWIVIDVGYIALFVTRDLYLSAGLYTVLLAMSIKASLDWRASLHNAADADHVEAPVR